VSRDQARPGRARQRKAEQGKARQGKSAYVMSGRRGASESQRFIPVATRIPKTIGSDTIRLITRATGMFSCWEEEREYPDSLTEQETIP
jgi:hypothetical protein